MCATSYVENREKAMFSKLKTRRNTIYKLQIYLEWTGEKHEHTQNTLASPQSLCDLFYSSSKTVQGNRDEKPSRQVFYCAGHFFSCAEYCHNLACGSLWPAFKTLTAVCVVRIPVAGIPVVGGMGFTPYSPTQN